MPRDGEVVARRPKSELAKHLDEAFAGCDQWLVVRKPRRVQAGRIHAPLRSWTTLATR
jgi:hypothetical protein